MNDSAARILSLVELLVVQRCVGAAEVHGLGDHLLNAVAGTHRLVIDRYAFGLLVLAGPFTHHRVDKGGSTSIQALPPTTTSPGKSRGRYYGQCQVPLHSRLSASGSLDWMSCAN